MLTVYSTAPSSMDLTAAEFRQRVIDVARWSESAGCRGSLVYSDNSLVDPWLVAQFTIQHTETLVPLVAVQPAYMSPFTAARMISTTGHLHGRRLDLNLVTGGYAKHLLALGCELDHDDRYDRLTEYGTVLRRLLTTARPISHHGTYYQFDGAALSPPLQPDLLPRLFVSGSSAACAATGAALDATRLSYPRLPEQCEDSLRGQGMRFGVLARDTNEEAWRLAHERFPVYRLGEQLHDLAARSVQSEWHRRLSADAVKDSRPQGVYWLYPFRTYRTFCPYLVGDYQEVGQFLARYLSLGMRTVILDVPAVRDDLDHAMNAIRIAETITMAALEA